jgi:small conductance mechanosensitive channel
MKEVPSIDIRNSSIVDILFDPEALISLATALMVYVAALYIISKITHVLRRRMEKGSYQPPLPYFITTFIKTTLYVVVTISFFGRLGIPTQSFLAVLGAAGLAIGLALQNHLSNFAGGILILVFKPFKVGDRITALSTTGTVSEVKTFFTILSTANRHTVYLPNGSLFSGVMINHTQEGNSRVEYVVGISYQADVNKAIQAIEELLHSREEVLKDQPIKVFVSELAASSVQLTVFFYANNDLFWDVNREMLKEIKLLLDRKGIEIPFPQVVVHKVD